MHCSKLYHDLTVNNITDQELCSCGRTETEFHHFLERPLYIVQRNQLMFKTIFLPSLIWNIILNGDERITTLGKGAFTNRYRGPPVRRVKTAI